VIETTVTSEATTAPRMTGMTTTGSEAVGIVSAGVATRMRAANTMISTGSASANGSAPRNSNLHGDDDEWGCMIRIPRGHPEFAFWAAVVLNRKSAGWHLFFLYLINEMNKMLDHLIRTDACFFVLVEMM
jgi:hypothetical protein